MSRCSACGKDVSKCVHFTFNKRQTLCLDCCSKDSKFEGSANVTTYKPIVYEDIGPEPVTIRSPNHLREVIKRRNDFLCSVGREHLQITAARLE